MKFSYITAVEFQNSLPIISVITIKWIISPISMVRPMESPVYPPTSLLESQDTTNPAIRAPEKGSIVSKTLLDIVIEEKTMATGTDKDSTIPAVTSRVE